MFGILDAVAGTQKQGNTNYGSGYSNQTISLQDFNKLSQGQSQLEANTYQGMLGDYGSIQGLVNAGAGQQQITNALNGANQYSGLLQSFVNNQGLPSTQQQQYAQTFAQQMFQPQQTALQQSFILQNQQGARLAAALGRSGADPVLQAKLGISQTQQQAQLNAQQGAFAAQTAQGMPAQQAQYANQLYNVQQNLASQAFANRSALLQMGNQLNNSERQYRVQTANRSNDYYNQQYQQTSQGGFVGAVSGFQSGTGAEMGMISGLMSGAGSMMSGSGKLGGAGGSAGGGVV